MGSSPPGSSVLGILQARTLEWVTISCSRDLPNPGIEPTYPVSPALGRFFTTVPPGKPCYPSIILIWKASFEEANSFAYSSDACSSPSINFSLLSWHLQSPLAINISYLPHNTLNSSLVKKIYTSVKLSGCLHQAAWKNIYICCLSSSHLICLWTFQFLHHLSCGLFS